MTGVFADTFWIIIKILTCIGLSMYIVFSVVIVKQERLMSAVLEEGFEPVIKSLAVIHLIGSIVLLLLAIVVL